MRGLLIYIVLSFHNFLKFTSAEKWVQTNPKGSFAMGFTDGYINNGDYKVVVAPGSDDDKRQVMIESPRVRDSEDMVFHYNTMVFSNWDGCFKLGNAVYTDQPGVLYFMQRPDGKCEKKSYGKVVDEIGVISEDEIDANVCQALREKVDDKMNQFLQFPFKYMLPQPGLELKTTTGFPGGEYHTDKVYGNVYACQYAVKIPSGDSDKDKQIKIIAPGISDTVTMKVSAHTQIYGMWDGTFYLGDKVYTNEPRVLYIDDDKGDCVKKVYEDVGTEIIIAETIGLESNECFFIKNKVYNEMQKLITDPKLMNGDKKSKGSPPITVTSTVVYPGQSDGSQSTHTITVAPGASGTTTNIVAQPPLTSTPGVTHVHTSTVTSDHPDYPSVSATSVLQSPPPPDQPQAILINQGQTAQISPQGITMVHPNIVPKQVVFTSPNEVKLVVPPSLNPSGSQFVLVPAASLGVSLHVNPVPVVQSNAVNAQYFKIQPDGSLLLNGQSVLLNRLSPNTQLVTADGSLVRVARSVRETFK